MAARSSILTWKSHGQRSLVGYHPRGRRESDTTERPSRDTQVNQQKLPQERAHSTPVLGTVPIKERGLL